MNTTEQAATNCTMLFQQLTSNTANASQMNCSLLFDNISTDVTEDVVVDNETLLYQWNKKLFNDTKIVTFILFLYLIIGAIGNAIVVYVYFRYMKGKTTHRYFIPYLAIVDFVGVVVHCSLDIIKDFLNVIFPSDILCRILWYVGMATTLSSALILVVIAIHRYLLICKPHWSRMTKKKKRFALIFVVVFSLLYSVPCFFFYGGTKIEHDKLNITGLQCGTRHEFRKIARKIHLRRKTQMKKEEERKMNNVTTDQYSLDTDQYLDITTDISTPNTDSSLPDTSNMTSNSSSTENRQKQRFKSNYKFKTKSIAMVTSSVKKHFAAHRFSWIFMSISFVWILVFTPRILLMVIEAIDTTLWYRLDLVHKNALYS
ncbi:hypothetical protein KUTeg_000503 [Tegillarca granosa]|uniref:G-protein coupled receptors family 1 profile domain-containing protein n=1 Tax=Tegillarca granosa TaxID=220873 RepID=A0ABQ9G151_TEGGR|nr:hypothetical protein KUTeg_000503 [Tegillarca granosa]